VIASSLALLVLGAGAALPVGSAMPDATYEDCHGETHRLRESLGRPVLIVYESKEAVRQNDAFKKRLAELARDARYRSQVDLLPCADVEGYGYFPTLLFVRGAVSSESRQVGVPIFLDWSGAIRRAAGLERDRSGVLLIDRAGKLLFLSQGPLQPSDEERLLGLLAGQLQP